VRWSAKWVVRGVIRVGVFIQVSFTSSLHLSASPHSISSATFSSNHERLLRLGVLYPVQDEIGTTLEQDMVHSFHLRLVLIFSGRSVAEEEHHVAKAVFVELP